MDFEELSEWRRRRMAELAERRGGNAQLGRELGYRDGAFVGQMIKGTRPITEKTIERAESLPGCSGWFSDSNTEDGPQLRGAVPLLSDVQAGAYKEHVDNYHPGDGGMELISTSVPVKRHTFALRVSGDSMEPDFTPGMVLIVEPELEAMPGDFVIAKNGDGESTFKQLVKDGADWYLKPLNKQYPIKPLGNATVIGVVRAVERRFR